MIVLPAEVLVPGIAVGIEVRQTERAMTPDYCTQLCQGDGVITSQADGNDASIENWLQPGLDARIAVFDIAGHNRDIAPIGDGERPKDIDIDRGIVWPQQRRCLANGGGPEARPGAIGDARGKG